MKIVYSFFFFCFLNIHFLSSQTDVAAARLAAEEYMKATESGDWESVADLLYPKLFEISSREQIIAGFKAMENDSDLPVKLYGMQIDSHSRIHHHGDEKFILLDYSLKMEMVLKGADYQDEGTAEIILSQMKGFYGDEHVAYNETSRAINIRSTSTMIGLSPVDSNDWKFIDYKPGLKEALGDLFAEGLWERIEAAMAEE